jgi:hypothetical protein
VWVPVGSLRGNCLPVTGPSLSWLLKLPPSRSTDAKVTFDTRSDIALRRPRIVVQENLITNFGSKPMYMKRVICCCFMTQTHKEVKSLIKPRATATKNAEERRLEKNARTHNG